MTLPETKSCWLTLVTGLLLSALPGFGQNYHGGASASFAGSETSMLEFTSSPGLFSNAANHLDSSVQSGYYITRTSLSGYIQATTGTTQQSATLNTNATVSEWITLSSSEVTAGTAGIATLRYYVDDISLTGNTLFFSLGVSGTDTSISYSYNRFYDGSTSGSLPTPGILELEQTFEFGNGLLHTMNISMSIDAANLPSAYSSATFGNGPDSGLRFLGVASVRTVEGDIYASTFTAIGVSGTDYALTAVPEPSTYAIGCGVIALGLALSHRYRRQQFTPATDRTTP